jgi:hypothetical protein
VHPTTVSDERAGLYDDFEAYRTATDADYQRLLTSGLVNPDTNVLLNLYRYDEPTRDDLLRILGKLGSRLWVPHQVIAEFWRNRETILKDPRDTTLNIRQLSAHRDQAINTLRTWINRVGLEQDRADELLATLTQAFDVVTKAVSELVDEHSADSARDTYSDPVLVQLEEILQGRVGRPLDQAGNEEALKEAKSRAELKLPPGWKDAGKSDGQAAGDYLVWAQVLREARERTQDVLLITGDVKEDWWRREHGEIRGPLPGLVQEMKAFAGVRLFMLRPESLLIQARQALQIDVSDESVQDAERVDRSLAKASMAKGWFQNQIELEAVIASWPDILEYVKARRKVAWMLISNATPDSVSKTSLNIKFERDGDAKGFISAGCDTLLTEAINDQVQLKRRIVAVGPTSRYRGKSLPAEDPDEPYLGPGETTDEPPF